MQRKGERGVRDLRDVAPRLSEHDLRQRVPRWIVDRAFSRGDCVERQLLGKLVEPHRQCAPGFVERTAPERYRIGRLHAAAGPGVLLLAGQLHLHGVFRLGIHGVTCHPRADVHRGWRHVQHGRLPDRQSARRTVRCLLRAAERMGRLPVRRRAQRYADVLHEREGYVRPVSPD